jgi:hypothetical protein
MAEPSDNERAAYHRRSAETIRGMAAKIRFNHLRKRQLLALADAFDRLAGQIAKRGVSEPAN